MKADIILIPYFAEVIVGDKPEKVQTLQFSALRQLQARLRYFEISDSVYINNFGGVENPRYPSGI